MKPLLNKTSSNTKEWIYAFTDIYFAGARTLLDIFYTYFLSQVLGLPLSLAGTIYSSALISRAMAEPVIGLFSDQWETRWGKRKPFFVVGAPIVFFSFILLWYPFDVSLAAKLIIAWSGAILYGVISGSMMAPYAAMGPDLVPDYHGRTHLSNLRQLFQLIAIAVTILVFSHFLTKGQTTSGWYKILVILFGLLFSLPFVALTLFIPEVHHDFKKGPWSGALKKIRWPFRLAVFRWYAMMNVTMESILVLMPALFPFYLKFYMGTINLIPFYGVALSIGAAITLYLMMTKFKYICKITWFRIGSVALGCVAIMMLFITPEDGFLLYPLFMILGLAVATTSSSRLSMLSDLADHTSKVYKTHMQAFIYASAKSLAQWGAGICVFVIFQASSIKGETAVISGSLAKHLLLWPVIVLTFIAWVSSFAYHLDENAVNKQD